MTRNTFTILKQKNNQGPIYKVEIDKKTLTVASKEILNQTPDEWSMEDFYSFLDEGKRFDVEI